MPDKYWSIEELMARYKRSRSGFWLLRKTSNFPEPAPISSPRHVLFNGDDVDAWEKSPDGIAVKTEVANDE